ncbi:MAG: hypothetical protein AAF318_14340 [Pseudomonadota bacterium]
MRTALTLAFCLVAATAAARPDVRTLNCGAVQAAIDRAGAIVMTTGRHTYQRFVARRGLCMADQRRVPARITARDGACTVNGVCAADLFDDLPGFGRSR